jgi:hypothetical protein
VYADNIPDSRLGLPAVDPIPVPIVHTMATHGGSLLISNGPDVWESQSGFVGTFPRQNHWRVSAGGARVTGLASHASHRIAFTLSSMSVLLDGGQVQVLAQGVGCAAPRSIKALPDGRLIWLSRDGFYAWAPGMARPEMVSGQIHRLIRDGLSKGSMLRACSVVDPESREYRCFVSPAGQDGNTLCLCFDGTYWRELSLGYQVADTCATDDARHVVLIGGADSFDIDVFVMDREIQEYTPPVRTYDFLSQWLRGSQTARLPIHVHWLYVGFIDEVDETLDVYFYADGSYEDDEDSPRQVSSVGAARTTHVPDGRGLVSEDLTGTAVLGTSKLHERRLYWRKVPVGLENVFTWAFRIKSESRYHLAAVAFSTSIATMGEAEARVPEATDDAE